MEVKTFRAATLQEALQQVRLTLGPDAAVLTTRNLRQSRLGLFPKSLVEVEASADISVASRFQTDRDEATSPSASPASSMSSPASTHTSRAHHSAHAAHFSTNAHDDSRRERFLSEPLVGGLRASETRPTSSMLGVLAELIEAGVEPNLAKNLMTEASEWSGGLHRNDSVQLQALISRRVESSLRISGPLKLAADEQKVVAFVGPTGVGKTTTLAKIAAGFRFDGGCQIGLITLDTFRLGAVDQLLQYAELISAPLEVVSSPEQVTGALQRLRECDLVMLDTAGRSPKDAEQLAVLGEFLRAAEPDAIQLVVSAISSRAHVYDTIQKFSALSPTDLLITKLDEAVGFGDWLSVLSASTLPVSYLTAGQHVPQDIRIASARRLTSLLLGNAYNAALLPQSAS